jgi:phenylacetate-CoA ligase
MAENLIVEILGPDGAQAGAGETGRLTITDLRNYATPLIRYDIGDYAEVGPPCSCGRSLPTLRRVLGRERNLILMPDGTRHWPLVGFHKFREIAPIVQYQFIQDSRESIEMRLVVERMLDDAEESALRALVQTALGFDFAIRFVYFDGEIPAAPGGKFEEFVCQLPQ